MRILHVNDYLDRGGCEVLMRLSVERLAERGETVEMFTADGIEGHRRTVAGYIDSRRCRWALGAKLERFQPDVVHFHNVYHELSPGVLAAAARWREKRSCRIVMTAHDFHVVCPNAGLRWFRRGEPFLGDPVLVRRLSHLFTRRWDHRGLAVSTLKLAQHLWGHRIAGYRRLVDVYACPSRFLQSALECSGLPTVWLPNPAPPACAVPAKPAGPIRIVFAGRVEPEKGLAEFVAELPADFPGSLTVIGDGAALPAVRAVVAERRLEGIVDFLGHRPRQEVIAALENAHVAVLPSRWYENAPVLLLEALSRRTAPLVTDLGGMREIVGDAGVGYTYRHDEPGSLRRALDAVVRDHEAGHLNDFDAGAFLRDRSEEAYIDRLLRLYRTGAVEPG